jgi:hypothetical protein
VNVDTQVRYCANSTADFDVLWDDSRTVWLDTRLALGTLRRARRLLACRVEQAR